MLSNPPLRVLTRNPVWYRLGGIGSSSAPDGGQERGAAIGMEKVIGGKVVSATADADTEREMLQALDGLPHLRGIRRMSDCPMGHGEPAHAHADYGLVCISDKAMREEGVWMRGRPTDLMLHEYAHITTYLLYGNIYRWTKKGRRMNVHHGVEWKTEYARLQQEFWS